MKAAEATRLWKVEVLFRSQKVFADFPKIVFQNLSTVRRITMIMTNKAESLILILTSICRWLLPLTWLIAFMFVVVVLLAEVAIAAAPMRSVEARIQENRENQW